MLPTADWPEVGQFRDHWRWRPEWTPERPRVMWYLTFDEAHDLRATVATHAETLREAGADVIPPRWLHLTVTDVGFADQLDASQLNAARDSVRESLRGEPPLRFALGPVRALPGAVALPAHPAEPLRDLRAIVRRGASEAGIPAPDDIDGPYWPHVSLCYVNDRTDHGRLWDLVEAAQERTIDVCCGSLAEVLVTRRNGHYEWDVLDTVALDETTAHAAQRSPR